MYEIPCGHMTITMFAWEEDESKLALHFHADELYDEETEEVICEETDMIITFDREAGRQLCDVITKFFDGNWGPPELNGVNLIEYAKSLLKKPGQDDGSQSN